MPTLRVNDVEIYYELHGPEDADVVVLSNGVLMSTASWAAQTQALATHYRVLLYDCRGMWQSEHPQGPYSMDMHTDDLAALLDALDIESAHIAGISYGGEISLLFGIKYPQKTRSLIIASSVSQVYPQLEGFMQGWIAATRARDPEMLFNVTYPLNFSEAWIAANPEVLKAARKRYQELDFNAFLELLISFSELNITADLHKISAPTLVISGEDDLLKPRKYSDIIAREIPGAELVSIPAAGHAVCWEQPVLFNELILGFLARLGAARG